MNSNNNRSSLKIGGIAILIILVIAGALYSQRSKIVMQLAQRMVASSTSEANPIAQLSDGLHVGLCGAGSPFPDPRRSGPCTVVVAGKRMFVFDTGGGAARNISRMQLNPGQIEAVFFTHYHSDHIDGLGELMLVRWIQGNASAPLPIHGPQMAGRFRLNGCRPILFIKYYLKFTKLLLFHFLRATFYLLF